MAISTYKVTLKSGSTSSSLTKLVEIKSFPDLGGAPQLIETTTLNDAAQSFIKGVQAMAALEFTANYTSEDFQTVQTREATDKYYSIEFGENGVDGVFSWEGSHSSWVVGAGVNAVVDMKISIAPSTPITKVSD